MVSVSTKLGLVGMLALGSCVQERTTSFQAAIPSPQPLFAAALKPSTKPPVDSSEALHANHELMVGEDITTHFPFAISEHAQRFPFYRVQVLQKPFAREAVIQFGYFADDHSPLVYSAYYPACAFSADSVAPTSHHPLAFLDPVEGRFYELSNGIVTAIKPLYEARIPEFHCPIPPTRV